MATAVKVAHFEFVKPGALPEAMCSQAALRRKPFRPHHVVECGLLHAKSLSSSTYFIPAAFPTSQLALAKLCNVASPFEQLVPVALRCTDSAPEGYVWGGKEISCA
mmetsp:Transcript_6262/g.20304  ORF Transcript_6262/g.20304 Transcript_6262/m.20304 type:complete len:106 (-) Transcript_6262:497-814(-)